MKADPAIHDAKKACNIKYSIESSIPYCLEDRERVFKAIMQFEKVYATRIDESTVINSFYYRLLLYQNDDFLYEERDLQTILKSKKSTIQLAEWLRDALQLNLYIIETYKGIWFKRKIGVKYNIVLQSEYNVQSINPF